MQISIIIPVYNAATTLARCLDSVLTALGDIRGEIILVDNNSTDDSAVIIRQSVRQHPRVIRSLTCTTPSAGAARNLGASQARGQYLWFIDADDTIVPHSIAKLLQTATARHADIVMMGANRLKLDGSVSYLSAVRAIDKTYKSRFVRYGMGPWQIIVRRSWWQQYHFQFREDIIQEDMELMSALILHTDKFASINQPLYCYYETPDSVLHKAEFSPRVFDIFPALEGLLARFRRADALDAYHAELEWFFIWNLLLDSAADFAKFPEARSGFARSRAMLNKYFPSWRKNPFLRQKPLKLRLRVRLNYRKK